MSTDRTTYAEDTGTTIGEEVSYLRGYLAALRDRDQAPLDLLLGLQHALVYLSVAGRQAGRGLQIAAFDSLQCYRGIISTVDLEDYPKIREALEIVHELFGELHGMYFPTKETP